MGSLSCSLTTESEEQQPLLSPVHESKLVRQASVLKAPDWNYCFFKGTNGLASLTTENCILTLQQCSKDDYQLVFDFVVENFDEVVRSRHFAEHATYEQMIVFLNMNELNATELNVFKGTVAWAKVQLARQGMNQAHITQTMIHDFLQERELLRFIRFPVMGMPVLAKEVQQMGILTPEELLRIFTWIGIKAQNDRLLDLKLPPLGFPHTPRKGSFLDFKARREQAKAKRLLNARKLWFFDWSNSSGGWSFVLILLALFAGTLGVGLLWFRLSPGQNALGWFFVLLPLWIMCAFVGTLALCVVYLSARVHMPWYEEAKRDDTLFLPADLSQEVEFPRSECLRWMSDIGARTKLGSALVVVSILLGMAGLLMLSGLAMAGTVSITYALLPLYLAVLPTCFIPCLGTTNFGSSIANWALTWFWIAPCLQLVICLQFRWTGAVMPLYFVLIPSYCYVLLLVIAALVYLYDSYGDGSLSVLEFAAVIINASSAVTWVVTLTCYDADVEWATPLSVLIPLVIWVISTACVFAPVCWKDCHHRMTSPLNRLALERDLPPSTPDNIFQIPSDV